jgi:hypothetical protein
MRKVGIPFSAGFSTHGDVTGVANTITAKFRLDSATSTDAWTDVVDSFVEATPGYYVAPITLPTAGLYQFRFVSTDPRIGTHEGKVECSVASIDDVKSAIDAAQADISAIRTQIDVLDEASLNGISASVLALDTKVTDLTVLIDDTNNPSVTSLRELLQDITAAGSSRDSVIAALGTIITNATDDLEAMIRGDEFLSDGTTANPFFGKTTHDVYDKLVDVQSDIVTTLGTLKADLLADAAANTAVIVGKLDAIKNVVDANSAQLTDSAHGLAALKSMLDGINTNIDDGNSGTDDIISILNNATDGLAAIKTTIMDKLTIMDGKLDSIAGSVSSSTEVKVIL